MMESEQSTSVLRYFLGFQKAGIFDCVDFIGANNWWHSSSWWKGNVHCFAEFERIWRKVKTICELRKAVHIGNPSFSWSRFAVELTHTEFERTVLRKALRLKKALLKRPLEWITYHGPITGFLALVKSIITASVLGNTIWCGRIRLYMWSDAQCWKYDMRSDASWDKHDMWSDIDGQNHQMLFESICDLILNAKSMTCDA
jgi:hypothetical protein